MSGRVCANRSAAKAFVLLLCSISILPDNARGNEKVQVDKAEGVKASHPGITVVANNSRLKMAIYQWSYENGGYRLLRTSAICDAQVLEHRHSHLGTGEINGDGQDDLVIGTNDGVYMIDGDGPAVARRIIEPEMASRLPWFIVAVADYDDDGLDEIIYASMESISIYGWNGKSIQKENEINMRAGEIAVADVDGDGKVEMVFKKYPDEDDVSIRIYGYSQGQCILKAELTRSMDWRGWGRSAEDARQQTTWPGGSISTQGDASVFPVVKTSFQHYDILDYNDDSYPDIAVCGMGGVQIITNRAGKKFEPAGFVGDIFGFGPHLRVCDIDHDGREDVVVSANDDISVLAVGRDGALGRKPGASGEIRAVDGSPRAALSEPTWPPRGPMKLPRFRHMKFFDTDGDGKGELVTPENTGGNQWRLVVWKYERGSRPGLRRVWSSSEPINGFPWIVEGQLSKKIQDRLQRIE